MPDGVDVVDLDMEETPASVISGLQDDGIRVVCYLSAGSWEPYRADAADFPDSLLGEAYVGFEDERWLDIRAPSLRPLLTARIATAADKGCDAVDPDNVNGFENDTGFDLTADDQLEFNRWLFAEVHDHGMAVGLKNDLAQAAELVDDVEFQVNEECIQYDDCEPLSVFTDADKPVWSIEYEGSPSDSVCRAGRRPRLRHLDQTHGPRRIRPRVPDPLTRPPIELCASVAAVQAQSHKVQGRGGGRTRGAGARCHTGLR